MKSYIVTQKGGYQDIETFNKEEAELRCKELNSRVDAEGCWYISTRGFDECNHTGGDERNGFTDSINPFNKKCCICNKEITQ